MNDKILVVDDDIEVLAITALILERDKFKVVTAARAMKALDVFMNEKPFLVLTDLRLQNHIDGSTMADRMHRQYPLCIFIAMSGALDAFEIGYLLGSVFTDILPKPCSAELILEVAHYAKSKRQRWDKLLGSM